uniref:AlNc14C1G20 protein n=1 Tax=Albugo laibachii Nc14 TaxID=890382 RepID=F0VYL3_9STRA|nr:AlNc14C1G20 [Albugo laibachii Nc14]|eukprot:CCA13877.1 AlNc14C1G20 [Albugo laibachii Nc14]
MKTTASIAISTALLFGESAAHKQYCEKIPNCALFMANNTGGLGHVLSSGGGPRNQFGLDFKAAKYNWETVCIMDSDKDGTSNGCELGDCCCLGVGKEQRTTDLALPGDPKNRPKGTYDSSKCDSVSSSSTPSQTKNAAGHSRMSTAHLGCIGAVLAIVCIQLL